MKAKAEKLKIFALTLLNFLKRCRSTLVWLSNSRRMKGKLLWLLRRLNDWTVFLRREMQNWEIIKANFLILKAKADQCKANLQEWRADLRMKLLSEMRLKRKIFCMKINWEKWTVFPEKLFNMKINLRWSIKRGKDWRLLSRVRVHNWLKEID